MLRRLIALVFILAVANGALAAAPLRACDHESGAAGVDAMECCRKARAREDAHGAQPSELCCSGCARSAPATAGESEAVRVAQSHAAEELPAALPPRVSAPKAAAGIHTFHPVPLPSKPAYILHLALLI